MHVRPALHFAVLRGMELKLAMGVGTAPKGTGQLFKKTPLKVIDYQRGQYAHGGKKCGS